jgi:hypothetical protein
MVVEAMATAGVMVTGVVTRGALDTLVAEPMAAADTAAA